MEDLRFEVAHYRVGQASMEEGTIGTRRTSLSVLAYRMAAPLTLEKGSSNAMLAQPHNLTE